jgi:hypothetical protein
MPSNNTQIYNPVPIGVSSAYVVKGLTFNSNNKSIHSRDTAGNILLESGSGLNQLLVVECIDQQYTVESITRVLNTSFDYYSFPVIPIDNVQAPLDEFDVPLPDAVDDIYARYKPLTNSTIVSALLFSQIDMDEVVDGVTQHVNNISKYYITKEIKNSGADLKFRVKINHRYDGGSTTDVPSTVAFSIIKEGPDYPYTPIYKNQQYSRSGEDGRWGVITPYEVWSTEFETIITNAEFEIGDVFSIGANCGHQEQFRYHTINADQSYWVITNASKNVDEWNQPI